jgi:hypothetical protein
MIPVVVFSSVKAFERYVGEFLQGIPCMSAVAPRFGRR